jgi:hypothetical protein
MSKKILIINDKLSSLDGGRLIRLKHPRTNEQSLFLLLSKNDEEKVSSELYELINYNQETTSCFIDDYVQSNLYVYFTNKFNLSYFLIKFISSNGKNEYDSYDDFKLKFKKSLSDRDEHLLNELEFFQQNDISSRLENLFDLKQLSDQRIQIKFNSSKCVEWLKTKCHQMQTLIETQMLSQNKKSNTDHASKAKQEAFELISQYLDTNLSDLLRKELNLNSPLDSTKDNQNDSKKAKHMVCLD